MELSIKWFLTSWLLLMLAIDASYANFNQSNTILLSSSANNLNKFSDNQKDRETSLNSIEDVDETKTDSLFSDSHNNVLSSLTNEFADDDVIQQNPKEINVPIQKQDQPHRREPRAIIQTALRLIDEKQCPEIRNLCSNLRDGSDDLAVLECVQTFLSNQIENLADECQHAIWTHTANIMNDANVLQIVQKPCQTVLVTLNLKPSNDVGAALAKLIDRKDEIKQSSCVTMISRLEAVAFSDFRFVSSFVRDCNSDVEINACGRFHLDRNVLSQGETLACLQTHIDTLTEECKKGIM